MRSQRVNNFFAKNFRDISHLITLIVSDLPRARQNVRFRSFPNHRTLLYQRLKIGILRRKVATVSERPFSIGASGWWCVLSVVRRSAWHPQAIS